MKKSISVGIMTLGLLGLNMPGHAALSSATGSASPSVVQVNSAGFSQIAWQVEISALRVPATMQVTSSSGNFRDLSGNLLERTTTTLSKTQVASTTGTQTLNITESLNIPLSVIRTVARQGDSSFLYERTFVDTGDNSTRLARVRFSIQSGGSVIVTPSSGATSSPEPASLLSISAIQLRFADNRSSAIISRDTPISASAVLNYNGTGVIHYQWELASPPSTLGRPTYVPIDSQRQYLLAGGRIVISSPRLPSDRTGEYRLRLRISLPTPERVSDNLRYVVRRDAGDTKSLDTQEIRTLFPAAGAQVTPDTEFQWQAIAGAHAYQLEIYDSPHLHGLASANQAPLPVTGVLIPAARNRLALGAVSWRHLRIGGRYWWRVIGLAADGHIIGQSPLVEMHTP